MPNRQRFRRSNRGAPGRELTHCLVSGSAHRGKRMRRRPRRRCPSQIGAVFEFSRLRDKLIRRRQAFDFQSLNPQLETITSLRIPLALRHLPNIRYSAIFLFRLILAVYPLPSVAKKLPLRLLHPHSISHGWKKISEDSFQPCDPGWKQTFKSKDTNSNGHSPTPHSLSSPFIRV